MDLYRNPKTPEERFRLLAERLTVAMGKSEPLLHHDVRQEFINLVDAEAAWALALILSSWRLAETEPRVQNLLAPYNVTSLYAQVSRVPLLRESTEAAYTAKSDADLSASASYFASAVKDLGASVLRLALGSGAFKKVRVALLKGFPLSPELRGRFEAERQAQPALAPPPVQTLDPTAPILPSSPPPSRARRFDRADYRPRTQPQEPQGAAPAQSAAPLALSAPALDSEDVTRTYQRLAGWPEEAVARFMSGRHGNGVKGTV